MDNVIFNPYDDNQEVQAFEGFMQVLWLDYVRLRVGVPPLFRVGEVVVQAYAGHSQTSIICVCS